MACHEGKVGLGPQVKQRDPEMRSATQRTFEEMNTQKEYTTYINAPLAMLRLKYADTLPVTTLAVTLVLARRPRSGSIAGK